MRLAQRVHSVLHRVGGKTLRVVAVRVDGLEVALKRDRHVEFANGVHASLSRYLHQADARFAVVVLAKEDLGARCTELGAEPPGLARLPLSAGRSRSRLPSPSLAGSL